jgi:hypothetical protein
VVKREEEERPERHSRSVGQTSLMSFLQLGSAHPASLSMLIGRLVPSTAETSYQSCDGSARFHSASVAGGTPVPPTLALGFRR